MSTRPSLLVFRATFFATLGLSPLVACSSSDEAGGAGGSTGSGGGGGADASAGAGGTATGGASTGGTGTGGRTGGGTGGTGGTRATRDGGSRDGGDGAVRDGAPDAGPSACANPTARIGLDGKPTGFVDCAAGFSHRPVKRDCATALPRATACSPTPVPDAGLALGQCAQDTDCKDAPNGYCSLGGLAGGCFCTYGCTKDDDCGVGQLCACASPVGQCVPTADCATDGDCAAGALCMTSFDMGGCGVTFACQKSTDTCLTSADCTADGGGTQCGYTDHHECVFGHPCGTGRPFLVGGAARVAPVGARAGWASESRPDIDGLDGAARAALAGHWTEIAQMEHASIAAFARFSLDLLSLGAPPELLVDAQAAMADETVHARDAFALASAYAGGPLGPGLLDVDSACASRSAVDIVRTAILEGCIGETVAAVEAAEALAHATDPSVRAALSRVLGDETRHAALAWRFVRWVLEHGAPELRAAAIRTLLVVTRAERAAASDVSVVSEPPAAALRAHGLLDLATRVELRRQAIADVVAPCAEALVAAVRRAAPRPTGEVVATV